MTYDKIARSLARKTREIESLVDHTLDVAEEQAVKSAWPTIADRADVQQLRHLGQTLVDVSDILGAQPPGIKSVRLAVAQGSAIKALDASGMVGGYLIKFGGGGDLSPMRDIFMKSTYYGRQRQVDAFVHHGILDGPLGDRVLTNPAELEQDDVGVQVKLLLDLRDKYEKALYGLVQQGKLGWSSGSSAHLVRRERQRDGSHIVKRWIISEASLTPQPAGGLDMTASAMKSLIMSSVVDGPGWRAFPTPYRATDYAAINPGGHYNQVILKTFPDDSRLWAGSLAGVSPVKSVTRDGTYTDLLTTDGARYRVRSDVLEG